MPLLLFCISHFSLIETKHSIEATWRKDLLISPHLLTYLLSHDICGFWRLHSDHHAWRQAPLPAEPLLWPWEGVILIHSFRGYSPLWRGRHGVEFVARMGELWLMFLLTSVQREKGSWAGLKSSRPTPRDPLPPFRLHLSNVQQVPKTAASSTC